MLAELPSPVPVMVAKNVFVGYLPQTYQPNAWMNYRGDMALTVAFSELNSDFSLVTKVEPSRLESDCYEYRKASRQPTRPGWAHAAEGTIGAVD